MTNKAKLAKARKLNEDAIYFAKHGKHAEAKAADAEADVLLNEVEKNLVSL